MRQIRFEHCTEHRRATWFLVKPGWHYAGADATYRYFRYVYDHEGD